MHKAQDLGLDRINAALADVAELLLKDTRYLPIFERLSDERDAISRQEDAISRARAIVQARTDRLQTGQAKCSGTGNATSRTISNRSANVMASP